MERPKAAAATWSTPEMGRRLLTGSPLTACCASEKCDSICRGQELLHPCFACNHLLCAVCVTTICLQASVANCETCKREMTVYTPCGDEAYVCCEHQWVIDLVNSHLEHTTNSMDHDLDHREFAPWTWTMTMSCAVSANH